MPVTLLPQLEALVSTFLQTDADMVPLINGRCWTILPDIKEYPIMRVRQFDDIHITQRPLWLVTAVLQIEAWADTDYAAWEAASTAMGVLAARLEGVHSRGVVTGVRFGGMRNAPDPEFKKAKPRRIFTAQVTGHPLKPGDTP